MPKSKQRKKRKQKVRKKQYDLYTRRLSKIMNKLPYPILAKNMWEHPKSFPDPDTPAHLYPIIRQWIESDSSIFTITEDLLSILLNCDLDDSILCNNLKNPTINGCYFHFETPSFLLKGEGNDLLKGFFIETVDVSDFTDTDAIEGMEFMFCFTHTVLSPFIVSLTNKTLGEFLKEDEDLGIYVDSGLDRKIAHRIILFAALLLLYINCAQYRMDKRSIDSVNHVRKTIEGNNSCNNGNKKSGSKTDYILITPFLDEGGGGNDRGGNGSSKSPHFRRGHFRLQHWGPRNSMEKLIFLAPQFIHGGAKPKDYIVD
ncbi:MAG TPA: hypothetical protein ENH82_09010 [bacterium]|nr:hypothetical protein [bacterium]